jgi:hypothetical protein
VHEIFRSFVDHILGLFADADVEITQSVRTTHILDTSFYGPLHSRELQIILHADCMEFMYDIPTAESGRPNHENHWIVFIPRDHRSGTMRVYHKPYGYTELGYCTDPALVVTRRFQLPWDPKTMDL